MKPTFTLAGVVGLLLGFSPVPAFSENALNVVTTLSTYADITQTIGGDAVRVKSIAPPRFNPHFIEARPSDVLSLKRCDLFIHSGLDLEAWREPLVDASAREDVRTGGLRELDLSKRVELTEMATGSISRAEGDIHLFGNPHYWLSPTNGLIIAEEIAEKLAELDPNHASVFQSNLANFRGRLEKKTAEWKQALAPYAGAEFVGYHNEWVYLMNFAGFKMRQFLEPKPGIPPTPQHLSFLTNYISSNKVRGIVQATFYPTEAGEALAKKTTVPLLLLSQSVGEQESDVDYITLLEMNVAKLLKAVQHG